MFWTTGALRSPVCFSITLAIAMSDPDNRIPLGRNGYCLGAQGVRLRILHMKSAPPLADRLSFAGK
jgi:hypothetical protein